MTASGTNSIGDAWRSASLRIDRLDARLLLEYVSGCSHTELIARPERTLPAPEYAAFLALVARREAGEPLAYLIGSAWCCGLEFEVTPDVLIPREDTEVLIEQGCARAASCASPRILDLGTGSGLVAIALAKRCPQASVTAVDASAGALQVARRNATRHGVDIRFLLGDWYAPLGGEQYEVIVSNPPYVAEGDPHLQHNGLPFEPRMALTDGVAGGDGTACLKVIVEGARAHLPPGGWLLIEHGYDQAVKVRELLHNAGFDAVQSWRDVAAIERVSGGCAA